MNSPMHQPDEVKSIHTANKTQKLVMSLVEDEQDFEFYPTTDEIIQTIKNDIDGTYIHESPSILDCGAGDGRVLKALTKGKKYAIEKSKPLLNALDKEIFIIGTDFVQQTLIDKRCEICFSNPPYSTYEAWSIKIIKEANCSEIYLVIPNRWKDSKLIQETIELREGETSILGSFDFLDAHRAARATVDVVKIRLSHRGRWSGKKPKTCPFKVWFDENFKIDINSSSSSDYELKSRTREDINKRINNELVKGSDLVTTLESFYQRDLKNLISTYQSLSDIDSSLLRELDVNIEGVQEALELKISGLKDIYWHKLFNNFDKITDRLTTKSREQLLSTLTAHTHVDFTVSNAYAIICWVVKNSNEFFDSQLINTVERMTEKANVKLYKSNERTYGDERWRYCQKPNDLEKYLLDYRIVLQHVGGLEVDWRGEVELSNRAGEFINDLCAVAMNIGFDTYRMERSNNFHWDVHVKNTFQYRDTKTGELKTLFECKAYKNQNLHLRMSPSFIARLNVEFGRLKGWIKSPKEAANEMDVSFEEAVECFGSNIKLEANNFLQIGHSESMDK